MTEPTKQQRREIEIIVEVLQSRINYAQKEINWLRRDIKSWQEDIERAEQILSGEIEFDWDTLELRERL